MVRTVDGDTIYVRLARGVEKVRYIGVDTPESVKPDTLPESFRVKLNNPEQFPIIASAFCLSYR